MTNSKIILGIDPGLGNTGWGVVRAEGNSLSFLAGGVIKTNAKEPSNHRLAHIHNELLGIIKQYQPTAAAVEEVFVNSNARTSLKLGQARGIALLVPSLSGLDVAEYTPLQVKKAVVGYGRADKSQVGTMVKMLLPTATFSSEDTADALAVAICHAHTASSLVKIAG